MCKEHREVAERGVSKEHKERHGERHRECEECRGRQGESSVWRMLRCERGEKECEEHIQRHLEKDWRNKEFIYRYDERERMHLNSVSVSSIDPAWGWQCDEVVREVDEHIHQMPMP